MIILTQEQQIKFKEVHDILMNNFAERKFTKDEIIEFVSRCQAAVLYAMVDINKRG
jgi:hypothetical protein